MGENICGRCGEPLRWDEKKGWVHLDGKGYRTKICIVKGKKIEYDDHCLLLGGREEGGIDES